MERPLGGARGLEALLLRAAADASFRDKLVALRERAAPLLGVALADTEVALLRAMPLEQLEALGATPAPRRRGVLGNAATAAVVLGTVGFAACGGARASMPPAHILEPPAASAPETAAEPASQDAGAAPVLQGAQK